MARWGPAAAGYVRRGARCGRRWRAEPRRLRYALLAHFHRTYTTPGQ